MTGTSTSPVDARVVELLEALVSEVRALREAQVSPPSPLLTRDQLAELLQVHPRSLRRLELLAEVPRAIEIGGSKRWKRADVERWLAKRCAS